jgi:hypothetical protein
MTGGYPVDLARYGGQGEVKDLVKVGCVATCAACRAASCLYGTPHRFAVMWRGAGPVGPPRPERRKDRGLGHGDRDLSAGRAAYVTVWTWAGAG